MNWGSLCGTLFPRSGDHTADVKHVLADESKASEAKAGSVVQGEAPHTGASSALPPLVLPGWTAFPFSKHRLGLLG